MPEFDDLTGRTFGNWTVIKLIHIAARGLTCHSSKYLCRCICGKEARRFRTNIIQGKNKGCGCAAWNITLRPYEGLYRILVREAKRSHRVLELSYEEFLEFTNINSCHYCGVCVVWSKSLAKQGNAYHLDRKDNSLGYSKSNCVVCCPRCNRAKSNHFTYEEWVQIGALIRSWHT